jgi:guanylate kinase
LTVTSRQPRRGEADGKDYHFVTKQKFIQLQQRGYFFETKKYLEDFYGTPRRFVYEAEKQKKHPLLCIDVEGALKVKKAFKERSLLIFILPPSEKALSQRLTGRKSEEPETLKKRLRIAKKEVKYAEKYDYSVLNQDLIKILLSTAGE